MKSLQIFTTKTLSISTLFLFLFQSAAHAQWTTSGSNVYLTTTTNRVGIGLTAPAVKLHVSSNGEMARMQSSTNVGYMSFYSNTSARIGYVGMVNNGYNMELGTVSGNANGKTLIYLGYPAPHGNAQWLGWHQYNLAFLPF